MTIPLIEELSCLLAVQHERKPIIDKKEYTNNTEIKFNPNAINAVNKIFIRKDLNTETGLIPNPFCPSDLGLQFLNKRIGKVHSYLCIYGM